MSDPYDLLRRAAKIIAFDLLRREAIEDVSPTSGEEWLIDYSELPGVKLSKTAIDILGDPHRRLRGQKINKVIEKLIQDGYLREVHHVGGPDKRWMAVRLTKKGSEALRLRAD